MRYPSTQTSPNGTCHAHAPIRTRKTCSEMGDPLTQSSISPRKKNQIQVGNIHIHIILPSGSSPLLLHIPLPKVGNPKSGNIHIHIIIHIFPSGSIPLPLHIPLPLPLPLPLHIPMKTPSHPSWNPTRTTTNHIPRNHISRGRAIPHITIILGSPHPARPTRNHISRGSISIRSTSLSLPNSKHIPPLP